MSDSENLSDISDELFASDSDSEITSQSFSRDPPANEEICSFCDQAENLQHRINELWNRERIPGLAKLRKCVVKECAFLKSQKDSRTSRFSITTSNLPYLEVVYRVLSAENDVVSIFKRFRFPNSSTAGTIAGSSHGAKSKTCEVDIVSENGAKWIKVKAQSPLATQRGCEGESSLRYKNLIESLKRIVHATEFNKVHFQPPKVVVVFSKGVTESIARSIRDLTVFVRGDILSDFVLADEDTHSGDDSRDFAGYSGGKLLTTSREDLEWFESTKTREYKDSEKPLLNVDVTALVSYVSDMTNGYIKDSFRDEFLRRMASDESKVPALPLIEKHFANHSLIICQTANDRFRSLMTAVGGDRELERSKKLMSLVTVVPDQPSERSKALKGGSLSPENKIVFGTGDFLQATTLTANQAAVRSAASQGVDFSVYFHPARSLTEREND
uniref:UPF0415 protein C7orf25 homolog n=1 Tax=Hirondellea gigas TaxID=1518452 RepID=A0A6A7G5P8_9CRUS